MYRTVILTALLLTLASGLEAQRERQTGFMVHQMSVCPMENVADINRLNALTTPILDDLVEEGMIREWYDLRHGWGDEWNVVFVTVANSHREWLDFWSEYVRRANELDQDIFTQYNRLCTLHKDNMYGIRDSGGS